MSTVLERWVVNASPLIVLCQVQHQHVLLNLADELVVPQPVAHEIAAGPPDDPARRFLAEDGLPLASPPPIPYQLAAWDLGHGETAVLAYAMAHPGWTAILDDRAARRCAAAFAVPVKGTLGIILLARRRGLIPSASDVLRQLRQVGLRLDARVIAPALWETVGEVWTDDA